MRRKPKLRFTSEQKLKARRTRAFILAFAAFVLVFGAASVLLFLHSIDYDLNNLISPEETTAAPEETTTGVLETVQVQNADVFYVCVDSDDSLVLLSVVSADAKAERISVCTLSPADTAAYSGETSTFSAIYQKYGLAGLRESVASALGISLERYVKQTETQLRQVIGEIGDISVNVPASIEYRGADYTLFLDAGEQSLTGDLFVKYIRYSAVAQQADAVCALVQNLLSAFDPADLYAAASCNYRNRRLKRPASLVFLRRPGSFPVYGPVFPDRRLREPVRPDGSSPAGPGTAPRAVRRRMLYASFRPCLRLSYGRENLRRFFL